jgi:hypothetical protein
MKAIVELNDYRTRVAYHARRGEVARAAEVHPFVPRQAVRAVADADANRSPPRETFVSLAFMRRPDARASLPLGPCLPRPARRHFEARIGDCVRVRCRLPDTQGQAIETVIIE